MKIGILSDTHGNISITKKCVAFFRKLKVESVFHCGDIGSFEVAISRPMGVKRSGSKNSFVSTIVDTVDEFYAEVVQHLSEWQPAAPKLTRHAPDDAQPQSPNEASSQTPKANEADQPAAAPVWPSAGTWKSE